LFIDSATEACTAGLWLDGEIISRFELAPRAHTRLLLPMVQAVLAEAGVDLSQLDLIAFGRGPGSFTGVRIATACAQGIAMGLDIPVLGVSTLATLAQAQIASLKTAERRLIHVALDARMGEVYHATYRALGGEALALIGSERVLKPAALMAEWHALPSAVSTDQHIATGSGFGRYDELIQAQAWCHVAPDALPCARYALILAAQQPRDQWLPPEQAAPVYLRDNVAEVKGAKLG